jgi:hypothetical protein
MPWIRGELKHKLAVHSPVALARSVRMTDTKQLATRYVFVDTQAYVAAAFDWTGPHLGKLANLCRDGTLKLLTSSITRREINRKIEERLDEAIAQAQKHRAALANGGLDLELLRDRQQLLAASLKCFEVFLREAKAIEVPLDVSLDTVLDDYFNVAPPFSKQKGKEFPDAFVGASLVAWLRANGQQAYVVSADPDWRSFCGLHDSLIHAKTLSDVISLAIVSAETHAALVKKIKASRTLMEKLEKELRDLKPRPERGLGRREPPAGLWVRGPGDIISAKVLGINDVNVIDSSPPSFACEIEFEAELNIRATVVDETNTTIDAYTQKIAVQRSFVAVVELLFGLGADDVVIEKIHDLADQLVIRREDL